MVDRKTVVVSQEFYDGVRDVLDRAPNWIDRGQTTTVVTSVSILEEVLEATLLSRMPAIDKKMHTRLFKGYGPLSSMAAKTDICFVLGVLSKSDYDDLNIIRQVRNIFAHSSQAMGFETSSIADLVSRMKKTRKRSDTPYRHYFARLHEIGHNLLKAASAKAPKRRVKRRPRIA
jgi:DNA-binding MltR family transcriptional regulator